MTSDEPIGPGASVNTETDPIRLAMAATVAWGAGLPAYVYHSDAGTRETTPFEDEPGVSAFTELLRLLPPGLPNWERNDGREATAPFTPFADDVANAWWPERCPPHRGAPPASCNVSQGMARATGAAQGRHFCLFPLGILPAGAVLEARRDLNASAFHPVTGVRVAATAGVLRAGERWSLPGAHGGLVVKGEWGRKE